MKKLLILLLVLSGCVTSQKAVKMNYSVSLADHGTILCREVTFSGDTTFLWDAGINPVQKWQSKVSDIRAIGFKEKLIVPIK